MPDPSTAELALRAEKKQSSMTMTMTRASLIGKGIIYSPALGTVAFTLPGMADYVNASGTRACHLKQSCGC